MVYIKKILRLFSLLSISILLKNNSPILAMEQNAKNDAVFAAQLEKAFGEVINEKPVKIFGKKLPINIKCKGKEKAVKLARKFNIRIFDKESLANHIYMKTEFKQNKLEKQISKLNNISIMWLNGLKDFAIEKNWTKTLPVIENEISLINDRINLYRELKVIYSEIKNIPLENFI